MSIKNKSRHTYMTVGKLKTAASFKTTIVMSMLLYLFYGSSLLGQE